MLVALDIFLRVTHRHSSTSFLPVSSVLITAQCLQIAKLSELAQIAFGRSRIEAKMTDNILSRKLILIGYKFQNIDQFLRQRRFYRPFTNYIHLNLLFIDHFLSRRYNKLVDIPSS